MATESDTIAATLLAGATAITVFSSFAPSLSEVRKAAPHDQCGADTRHGELAASATVLAFGVIATQMTKSWIPLGVSIISVIMLTGLYEGTLKMQAHKPTQKEKNNG
jgi:hypothetical protein